VPLLYPRSNRGRGGSKASDEVAEGEQAGKGEGREAKEEGVKERKELEKKPSGGVPAESSEGGVVCSSSSSSGGTTASSSNGGESTPPSSSNGGNDSAPTSLSKRSVPDVYPQVLALPITRRPLFPGFYKAVVVRNPAVIAAIKESLKRGQPYIGAFLLKDENSDSDM
jgi:Lon-like ATP-dependent protease